MSISKADARSFVTSVKDRSIKDAMRKLPSFRWAVVQSSSAGPPKIVTIEVGGNSSEPIDARYLASYTPTNGDTVLLYQQGKDRVVLGKLA